MFDRRTLMALLVALPLPLTGLAPVPAIAARSDRDVSTQNAMTARFDSVIDRALADGRIVGTVVIVMQSGRQVYRRAAGLADREAGKPVRVDTVFRLASVSKPYVSAAAMRLVETGRLNLDDPVTRHLPEFRPKLADGTTPVITVGQLLTHTSGLHYGAGEAPDGPYRRLGVSTGDDGEKISLAENVRRIGRAPLLNAPGGKWTYSLSIDVLGLVIERVTGQRLQTAVDRLILRPLGLRDTGFTARSPDRLAVAYGDSEPSPVRMVDGQRVTMGETTIGFWPSRALDPTAFPSGGAGMTGTATDFARFAEAIRSGGGPILKPATVSAMLRDQVGPQAQTQGPGWGWGYGWSVLVDPVAAKSPMARGTIQWSGAYGNNWFVDPANRITVVAFSNTAIEGMNGKFTTDLRDAVYTELGASGASAPRAPTRRTGKPS